MLDAELRKCREYSKWTSEVYKKYKNMCDVSGAKLMCPEAHHLIPFKELTNEWRKEEDPFYKDILWERIFDVDNGVVMSAHLHRKYHSEYRGNVNRKTYEKFKTNWRENNDMVKNYKIRTYKLEGWLEVVEIN